MSDGIDAQSKYVFVDGNGNVARRRWPDTVYPLRRSDGKTWAEAKQMTTQDTCEDECKLGECCAKAS